MSEEPEESAQGAEPPEMVEVTVRVPARVLADYDADVGRGIYETRDEALRCGLVESWRYYKGRYSTLRIELRDSPSKRPDTDKADAMDTLAAADALTDSETGELESGEATDEDDRR
jgi:Arc/MetJ-type ribon-helix-helix transcriptional regulator